MSNENKQKELSKKYFGGNFPDVHKYPKDEKYKMIFIITIAEDNIALRTDLGFLFEFNRSEDGTNDVIIVANLILFVLFKEQYLYINDLSKLNLINVARFTSNNTKYTISSRAIRNRLFDILLKV